MTLQYDTFTPRGYQTEDDSVWWELYQTLRKPVIRLVYTHMAPSWHGQEADIVEDIIQETLLRVWIHLRKSERGQVAPIASLPLFCKVIASNYCRDLRRRDLHLTPMASYEEHSFLMFEIAEDPQDIIAEQAWQEELFVCIADTIATFPTKQRVALLSDIACRMDFPKSPTSLQEAFLKVGIQLEEYRQPLPKNATERNKHSSALSTAYKRLRESILAREFDSNLSQATRSQKKLLAREDIQHAPSKVNTQISMILFVSSSIEVENISSQTIARTKTLVTEQHKVFTRETIDMDEPEKMKVNNLEERDTSMILEDPELARLALQLRQTRPPIIDSAYWEALQSELLETVHPEKSKRDGNKIAGTGAESETNNGQTTSDANTNTLEDNADTLEDDAELEALAHHLQHAAHTLPIDPRFQETLQEKLLDVVRQTPGTPNNKICRRLLAAR